MRRDDIVEATLAVLTRAETTLPPWVMEMIEKAAREEASPIARSQLAAILENVEIASSDVVPLCQDTGLPVFHLEIGRDIQIPPFLEEAIAEGVRRATETIPLRPNAVDPLTRKNTGDNTGQGMPDLIIDLVPGNTLRITAFPKGAGSENASFLSMQNPADDPLEYVAREVAKRAGRACAPVFVGVGIGGTFDLAPRLAKRALFNMPGSSDLELDLLSRINEIGPGPMGLGGRATALAVKVETALCHTASLPVAVNIQCWANRSASATVRDDGWSID
ncbi:MAG TPA: fumarate hydratase [Methanothrix sp.]|nr:fumarate hydratase [Methanothrix sp.]HPJ83170.1 fumarate hydratase [Methanothrix sp.]HPR67108.1 fumarate hydratase [Methanothrix sp.]